MTNTLSTPAPATASTPASVAVDALTDALTLAATASADALSSLFPAVPNVDAAAVRLALATARYMAGGKLPNGGNGTKVGACKRAVLDAYTDGATATEYVAAARVALDAAKETEKARRDALAADRASSKAVANDRTESTPARQLAFENMGRIDAIGNADKSAAAHARISAALGNARLAGVSLAALIQAVEVTYGTRLMVAESEELAA